MSFRDRSLGSPDLYPFDVVSHYADPKIQVGINYLHVRFEAKHLAVQSIEYLFLLHSYINDKLTL